MSEDDLTGRREGEEIWTPTLSEFLAQIRKDAIDECAKAVNGCVLREGIDQFEMAYNDAIRAAAAAVRALKGE